jgi:anti-sigma B factor antagonist
MNITTKTSDGTAEVFLDGWLDTPNAPDLARALSELGPDVSRLVIDCTKLEYISSAGIRQIVGAQRKMKGALTIRHPSEDVMGILHLVALDRYMDIER